MSHRVKGRQQSPEFKQQHTDEVSSQYPFISFRYLTSNSKHSLDFIRKQNLSDRDKTLSGLLERLKEITQSTWEKLGSLPKDRNGYETLSSKELFFRGQNEYKEDQKVIVFRFDTWQGHNKGRIIGLKESPNSTFFIIGFDFDFTAYKHG